MNDIRSGEGPRLGAILDHSLNVLDIAGAPFDPARWLNRPVVDLFAADDRERVGAALGGMRAEGAIELSATLMLDEQPRAYLVRICPGSSFVHLTAEPARARSETFPKRENRLEQLGLVASQVSHDLKNLLAAVLINAELIPRTARDPDGLREVSREIVLATERARELLEQILGYASATEEPLRMVDLNALTREMGRLLEVSSPPTVALRYDLQANLPPVHAHAPQLRQMLMNFIVNASDAIGDAMGAITIATGTVTATPELLQKVALPPRLPRAATSACRSRTPDPASTPRRPAASSTRSSPPRTRVTAWASPPAERSSRNTAGRCCCIARRIRAPPSRSCCPHSPTPSPRSRPRPRPRPPGRGDRARPAGTRGAGDRR